MVASEFIRVHVIRWWVLGTAASLLQYSTNWTLVNLLDQYIHIDHCSPAAPAVLLAWLLLKLVYCRVQTHHRWPPCRKMGHPPNPPDEPAGPYLAVCKVLGEILSALVGLAGWPGLHVHGWRPWSRQHQKSLEKACRLDKGVRRVPGPVAIIILGWDEMCSLKPVICDCSIGLAWFCSWMLESFLLLLLLLRFGIGWGWCLFGK